MHTGKIHVVMQDSGGSLTSSGKPVMWAANVLRPESLSVLGGCRRARLACAAHLLTAVAVSEVNNRKQV